MLPVVTGEFRVVEDPELRFTPQGAAVANIRLVANSRKKNEAGEWVDDKVVWLNGTLWRDYAENLVESVRKGDLVIVTGKLETRSYVDREGAKRQAYDLMIDEIGPSLRFRQVLHTDTSGHKVTREGAAATTPDMANDPWATPPASADEPPFNRGSWSGSPKTKNLPSNVQTWSSQSVSTRGRSTGPTATSRPGAWFPGIRSDPTATPRSAGITKASA